MGGERERYRVCFGGVMASDQWARDIMGGQSFRGDLVRSRWVGSSDRCAWSWVMMG